MRNMIRMAVSAMALAPIAVGAQAPDRSRPPALGPAPALSIPTTTRRTLANGLTVLHLGKHDVPLVQINVVLRVGSSADPADRPGVASMVAAMLDEGAGELDALEFADAVDYLGARLSISDGYDATVVGMHAPLNRLDPALALLADAVLRPRFDAAELDRQRRRRLTVMLQARDEPRAIAQVIYDQTLFGDDHPYGRQDIGTPASLAAMTRDDIVEFHRQWFVPNNAAVVVVGDVELEDILPLLETAFAGWTPGSVRQPAIPTAAQVASRSVTLVDKPGAAQSEIRIGRIGVARNTDDYYALQVLNTILGGSFTSRLNQRLREEKGYTYGARSGFAFRAGAGPFTASAAVQTASTDSSLYWFMYELQRIMEPVPAEEVERARNYVALRYPGAFQSVAQIAGQLENTWLYELADGYFNTFVPRILAVTAADVRRVAREYLDPERIAIIVVGDRAVVEDGIRGLDLGPIRILSVEDVLGPAPEIPGR